MPGQPSKSSKKPAKSTATKASANKKPKAAASGSKSKSKAKPAKAKPAKQSAKPKQPRLGEAVEQAMADAAVERRDPRGLMPVGVARDLVASTTAFTRGQSRIIAETEVTDADRVWAALLSLADAEEFVRAAQGLGWQYHPRGKANRAIVERYGDAALPWLAGRVRDGVLVNVPWCLGPSLLAIGTPAAFDVVWSLRGYDDTSEMVGWEIQPPREASDDELAAAAASLCEAWMRAHEPVALARLAELADAGDARAIAVLQRRARAAPERFAGQLAKHAGKQRAAALATRLELATELTEQAILERLDEACGAGDWPLFYYAVDGRLEYFGLRVIAARATKGDAWGIVVQRLSGSYPEALRIEQCVFGSEVGEVFADTADIEQVDWDGDGFHGAVVTGWGEDVMLDEGMLDDHDLRFGRSCEIGYHPYRVAVIRAYLAANPQWWPAAKDALGVLGLDKAKVIVDSAAFHHVIGPNGRAGTPDVPWEIMPSESPVYRSIAAALVRRDASAFTPGETNLDWRLHAHTDEELVPPWLVSRFAAAELGGWLAVAMREAAVTPDARGLVPLADAHTALAGVSRFERGTGMRSGDHYVQGSDRVWAALLSLADASELAAHPLEWTMPVRGAATNTALAERYGAGALALLRTLVDAGVLHDKPGCARACVLHLGDDDALALLLGLDGFAAAGATGSPAVQLATLIEAWLDVEPARLHALVRRAAAGDERGRSLLRGRALIDDAATRAAVIAVTGDAALLDAVGVPRELSHEHVLAVLDRAAAGPAEDQDRWPRFFHGQYPGQAEYHALRVLAARARTRDAWAVVLERVTGYGNSGRVMHYRYGGGSAGHVEAADREFRLEIDDASVRGPAGAASFDPGAGELARLTEPPDYWAAREARGGIAPIRAYLSAHPGSLFTPATELVAMLDLGDPVVVADATAFCHADGPEAPPDTERRATQVPPSTSPAYRSLATAIATRDPGGFDPGAPNTDWQRHAVFSPDDE